MTSFHKTVKHFFLPFQTPVLQLQNQVKAYVILYNYYTDIDECTMGTDNCAPEATCTNTEGSFSCTCNQGYTGNGTVCTGKVLIQNHYVTCIHIHLFRYFGV